MIERSLRWGAAIAVPTAIAFATGALTDVLAYGLAAGAAAAVITQRLVHGDAETFSAAWVPWLAVPLNLSIVVVVLEGPVVDESNSAGWRSALACLLFAIYTRLVAPVEEDRRDDEPVPGAVRREFPEHL